NPGVAAARSGRIRVRRRSPTIRQRIVTGAGSEDVVCIPERSPTPNNHFRVCPHRRVIGTAIRRIGRAGRSPSISGGIIPTTRVRKDVVVILVGKITAPNNDFIAGPHRRRYDPRLRGGDDGRSSPSISVWILCAA